MKTLIVLGILTLANLIYAGLNNVKVHKENPFGLVGTAGVLMLLKMVPAATAVVLNSVIFYLVVDLVWALESCKDLFLYQ